MYDDLFSTRGLSLERLHTLLKLSEAGSLIRAANNDIGQQSRLSHHLRELSEFFGVDLTERSGKTIKLTPAGEAFEAAIAERLRSQIARAYPRWLKRMHDGEGGAATIQRTSSLSKRSCQCRSNLPDRRRG